MAPVNPDRFRIKRPTLTELMYQMDVVLGVDRFGQIEVMKNRYGNPGTVTDVKQIVDMLSLILVKHLFNNKMKIFQEGMRDSIKEAIEKIIEEGRCNNDTF